MGEWETTKLECKNCKTDVTFRFTYKKAQFLNYKTWVDIAKHAEVVLCTNCGATVYISSIKQKAQL